MRESSVVVHKGGKEDKYELYIEDYVMSFLKGETGTLELSEFYFYGLREDGGRRFVIYGAGKDRNVPFFDKYAPLDEIGCRLTQAGPVFLVREEDGDYEIKGYKVFYQDNREMQNYLIDRQRRVVKNENNAAPDAVSQSADMPAIRPAKAAQSKMQHSAISVQLVVVLTALVAIVINSANSYDKMNQLNRSATEVFFAMENQEAGESAGDERTEEDTAQEDTLKLVSLENEERTDDEESTESDMTQQQTAGTEEATAAAEAMPENETGDSAKDETEEPAESAPPTGETGEAAQQEGDTQSDTENKVEALSRNVARYYEVEKGDTLYTISRKIYGDTTYVQEICELNKITDPDHIRYGQKIVLP